MTDTIWSWVLPLGVSQRQAEEDRREFARIRRDKARLAEIAERLRELGH